MRIFSFTEQPYPAAWDRSAESLRVTLPNAKFDPEIGAGLLNRYLDEWAAADELGLDIMMNEHHSTATCLSASVTIPLAILAKTTQRARLLALGVPLGNRTDPVRVAEELSYIDVVSRGRLEMGFVRGIPYEILPANSNPADMMERLWEAHDLIIKAMTSHDGPFNWEGNHFHYRHVNIWPRPYQQPRPEVWITAASPSSANAIAERGHTIATLLSGLGAERLFHEYRKHVAQMGRPAPRQDKFAYLGLMAVGRNEAEAHRRLQTIREYLNTTVIVAPGLRNPPGYVSPQMNAAALGRGRVTRLNAEFLKVRLPNGDTIDHTEATVDQLIESAIAFAGTPDQVVKQIRAFHKQVGGIGNILAMAQGGVLSHSDTIDNLSLIAKEVLPRIQDLDTPEDQRSEALERARELAV